MKTLTQTVLKACAIATVFFYSCSSIQHTTDSGVSLKNNRNPKFLDNLTLTGSNTSSISLTNNNRANGNANYNPSIANTIQTKYAEMLRVLPQAITNMSLYSFIDEWYGVRYHLGGTDKTGIDCSAFVQRLYEQVFKTSLVRTAFEQFNFCRLVFDTASLKEGDLVFFRIHSRRISHVGIYLMNNFFVHASSSHGVMISSLTDGYWQRYFAGAGEVPKGNM